MQALAPDKRPLFEGLTAAQGGAGEEIAPVEGLHVLQQAGAVSAGLEAAVGMAVYGGEGQLEGVHIQPGIAVRVELHSLRGEEEEGGSRARPGGEVASLAGFAEGLLEVVEGLAQAVAGLGFGHLGPEQPRQLFSFMHLGALDRQVSQEQAHLGRLDATQGVTVQGELDRSQQRDGAARHGASEGYGWLYGQGYYSRYA